MPDSTAEKPSVYLEMTIVSYLTARPSRDIIILARQELTRQWWEQERRRYRVFVSARVLEEAEQGDPEAAERRLAALAKVERLVSAPEIEALAQDVREALNMTEKAGVDAVHVSFAIYYELAYLLTWNCAHLANAENLRKLANFCRREGLWLPIVCTPEEMVQERW